MSTERDDQAPTNDLYHTQTSILPAAPAAVQIGNYEMISLLGRGGMGEVYLARHSRMTNRLYAVKTILPQGSGQGVVSRFEREIKVLSKLAHPNILYAVDAGEHEGKLYLVTEFIDGIDLTNLLKKVDKLEVADACEIVRQMALGLAAAHSVDIVHRDIKPSNVMLDRSGQTKILDLGLALLNDGADLALTSEQNVIGTPEYMSPEQWRGSHNVTSASDIYSLGCALHFLLVGKPPFPVKEYSSLPAIMGAHLEQVPPPVLEHLPNIDPRLSDLIAGCLAKLPDQRPSDCTEIAEVLSSWTTGSDLSALVGEALPAKGEQQSSTAERPRADITNLPTQNDQWSRIQSEFQWNWPLITASVIVVVLCIASLVMAYFGPGTTEAWTRRFDRLQDQSVPAGTGFLIESGRIILFVTSICTVCMLRFAEPVNRFFSLHLNNPAVWIARVVVLLMIAFFLRSEISRHWDPSAAGADMVKWAEAHGIQTTAEKEIVPYRWYLTYSVCIYVFVFAGMITCPMLQFCLSDFGYLKNRLASLAANQATTRKPQAKLALLYQFAHGCRDLTTRYVDAGGVLAVGIQYDYWIGRKTFSDDGFATTVMAWGTMAIMVALFLVICHVYSQALEITTKSFGTVDFQTDQAVNQMGLIWLVKSSLLNRLSGLVCLSLVIVAAVALMSRSH